MSDINSLDQVVEDAVNDSLNPEAAPVDTLSEVTDDTSLEAAPEDPLADPAQTTDPIDPLADPVQDEFEKRWGIPAKSITGRENRLPHSRVKTMVTKAEQEGYAKAKKELEGQFSPKVTEYEAKIKDYDERWEKVAQFEHVMENDPRTFLTELSKVPAYKEFFDKVKELAAGQTAPTTPQVPEGMPQPDQTLTDGTKVYSMEGLQSLLDWQAQNVEKRVTDRVSKQYAPMEEQYQQQQRQAQLIPVIEKQIAEARQWPNFTELEPEVVKILKADPQISLERAYVKAFQEIQVPRVSADRNKIRTELLAELKQKPLSSSAPTSQVRPESVVAANRSMDQIISDALKEKGLL